MIFLFLHVLVEIFLLLWWSCFYVRFEEVFSKAVITSLAANLKSYEVRNNLFLHDLNGLKIKIWCSFHEYNPAKKEYKLQKTRLLNDGQNCLQKKKSCKSWTLIMTPKIWTLTHRSVRLREWSILVWIRKLVVYYQDIVNLKNLNILKIYQKYIEL